MKQLYSVIGKQAAQDCDSSKTRKNGEMSAHSEEGKTEHVNFVMRQRLKDRGDKGH